MGSLHCWNIFCTVFIFSHFFIPFGHPLSFNITHFDPDGSTIAYEGDAGAAANGTVVLNKGGSYDVGWATYAAGVHIWEDCLTGITDQADFTAHFSFTIDNVNASDGAGLAFFLAPFGYPIPPNSAGKGLGLFNATTEFDMSKNHIVAVVFDTSPSPKGGPLVQHVGIIKNSVRPAVSAD